MARKPFRRGLRVEGLEERHMMAGDVTASVTARRLTITGGVEDSGIVITGLAGQIQVTGLEQGGSETTVNGTYRVTYKNINEIIIDMGGGDDVLVITNATLKSSLAIDMGDGEDIIGLGQFYNKTEFFIPNTHILESLVDKAVDPLLKPLSVTKDVTIDMGDGENILRARAVTMSKNFSLITGTDDDTLTFEALGSPTDADYLPGIAVTLATTIATGDGDDKLKLDRFTTKNLIISGGGDHDEVELKNITVTQKTTVSGNDGHDAISLTNFTTRGLSVYGNAGDDDVFVKNVTTTALALFDGGTGDNIFHNLEGNTFKLLSWKNFVTFVGPSLTSQINFFRVIMT
jgi:hypothetical protein